MKKDRIIVCVDRKDFYRSCIGKELKVYASDRKLKMKDVWIFHHMTLNFKEYIPELETDISEWDADKGEHLNYAYFPNQKLVSKYYDKERERTTQKKEK